MRLYLALRLHGLTIGFGRLLSTEAATMRGTYISRMATSAGAAVRVTAAGFVLSQPFNLSLYLFVSYEAREVQTWVTQLSVTFF